MSYSTQFARCACAAALLVSIAGCAPDEEVPLTDVSNATAGISGVLVGPQAVPIAGSVVQVGDQETTTNAAGEFSLIGLAEGVPLDLYARSDAWSTAHHRIELGAAEKRFLRLTALPVVTSTLASAQAGGEIETEDGLRLDFAPGALVFADGTAAVGELTVRSTLLRTPASTAVAPGGMMAVVEESPQAFPLESFGMVEVRLSVDGREVQPTEDVVIDLPLSLTGDFEHGEEVPLWSFDEETGVWQLEGEGTVLDRRFRARASHFSWWNVDVPQDTTCVGGTVTIDPPYTPPDDPTAPPVSDAGGITVTSTGVDYMGSSATVTQPDGSFVLPLRRASSAVLDATAGVWDGGGPVGQLRGSLSIATPTVRNNTFVGCEDIGTIVVQDTSRDDDEDGYTVWQGDCDDDEPAINPGAQEVSCNDLDEDCDGVADDGVDRDFDGQGICTDCDDTESLVYVGARDVCDGILDNDCDGVTDAREADEDNDGVTWCAGDCDDADPTIGGECAWAGATTGDGFFCGLNTSRRLICDNRMATIAEGASGRYSDVSADEGYVCGLLEDSSVECFGAGGLFTPAGLGDGFTAIDAGPNHQCGLTDAGAVRCTANAPGGIPAGPFESFDTGPLHGCALDAQGVVTCWGDGDDDRLALAGEVGTQVVTGSLFTCLLDELGDVRCVGDDTYGQLQVPEGWIYRSISAGAHHACGVTAKATVECWGRNDSLQSNAPAGRYISVHAGPTRTCAIDAQGAERCWGAVD